MYPMKIIIALQVKQKFLVVLKLIIRKLLKVPGIKNLPNRLIHLVS